MSSPSDQTPETKNSDLFPTKTRYVYFKESKNLAFITKVLSVISAYLVYFDSQTIIHFEAGKTKQTANFDKTSYLGKRM